ncbi:MAG: glycosyltransferase [Verrucomicrobia bacterium]|nr:glycosyltransferase [Verrucomicrobiota bacterium]
MPVELAIVVSVFNEAANVLPLAREVAEALAAETRSWELVFVDDGSTDATWAAIREARRRDPRVRGLRHARRAGQSAALWTGIRRTDSPVIATLDGDRQNDPADLPRLLGALAQADFVSGWRVTRRDGWLRRVSSRVARVARRRVLGTAVADTGCGLRVFKRACLEGVLPFDGWHRFLPVLVGGGGAATLEVPVNHRPRAGGVSKYGLWNRLGRGVVDLAGVAWYRRRRLTPAALSGEDDARD